MATRGVTGRVYVLVELDESVDTQGADDGVKKLKHRIEKEWKFASGTTDGTQIDRVWSSHPTLTTTPVDTDVIGTSNLTDVLDGSLNVNMSDMVLMCAVNEAASGSGDVQLGAGTNPFTGMLASGDVASVKPQGLLLWIAPYGAAAAAGVSDIIRAVASAGSVAARLILAGRSL